MRYRVLGPIEVERDGTTVAVGGPQIRRLLGLLLTQRGQVVTIDRIVDALWPGDDPPEGAHRSAMSYVSRLRSMLGDGAISTHPAGYVLETAVGTRDADEFAALVTKGGETLPDMAVAVYDEALSLWRGPAFGDMRDEWWAMNEANRLEELRSLAREERAQAMLMLGQARRAIPELEVLAAEQPLRERPVHVLMSALHASGRAAEALRVFHEFRERLADETGLEPSPELAALARSILDNAASGEPQGRPLRGYMIHEVIGQGAFGRVYAATQPGTNRRVAIKAIHPDLAGSVEFVRRFDAEAQMIARLEHPHIVPLYDYWREPSAAYLVFRLLPGGTARDAVISAGPWSLERANQLVDEIGAALITAHAAGVAHHDVTAANVLLDDDGHAYLSDFGIAVAGQPAADRDASIADDVRSFAWLLWELLSGSPPGAVEPAPSLIGRAAAVPEGLDAVLRRATTPGGYESVAELILAWRGLLSYANFGDTSDERRAADSARRLAARKLAMEAAAEINPYRGLQTFDEADAAAFFGRDDTIAELQALLAEHRLVTIVGASGSGKSSVVRAGLLPRLRAEGRLVTTMVPGDRPLAALQAARGEVASIGGDDGWPTGSVLIVDQFEELWTRSADDQREPFLEAVNSALDGGLQVVATVRADLLDGPLGDPRIGQLLGAGSLLLAPLSATQLDDVITMPALRGGVSIDPGVVAALVADTSAHAGSLPLLQFVLREIYDRRVDRVVGADALAAIGGMPGAIGRRAETIYGELDAAAQDAARSAFGRLVTTGSILTRRRARLTELTPDERDVVDRFAAARLLTLDRNAVTREPTVEVAHEAVLQRWPRLAEWIAADRDWFDHLQHCTAAATSWDGAGRPDAELYRGSRLERMLEAHAAGRSLSALEEQFVDASREARDAEAQRERLALEAQAAHDFRQNRRLRRAIALVAAFALVAVAAGAIAAVQRSRADSHRDRAEAARAEAVAQQQIAAQEALVNAAVGVRGGRRDLAALLAVEAHRRSPSAATENALFGLFTQFPGAGRTVELAEGPLVAGYFTLLPDGATIAAATTSDAVRLIDVATGRDVALLQTGREHPVNGWTEFFAATPDSRLLAVSIGPGADPPDDATTNFSVWNVTTRQAVFSGVDIPIGIGSLALSSDGRLLAAAGGKYGRTLILDATSGKVLRELEPIPRPDDARYWVNTVAVAFTSDDRLIVTSQAGPIRIVDPHTGAELHRFEGPPQTAEVAATLSPDESWLLTSGAHGVMRYDLPAGTPTWAAPSDHACRAVPVAPTGLALCAEFGGRVTTIDLATGGVAAARFEGMTGAIDNAATPDGSTVIVFGDERYSLWRTDGAGLVSRVLTRPDTPFIAGYTADGSRLLLNTEDDDGLAVEVVDAITGEVVDRIVGASRVRPTASPELIVMRFADGSIGWHDLATRGPTGTPADPGFEPADIIATAEGALVWHYDGHMVALDLAEGRVLDSVPIDNTMWQVRVAPNGRTYNLTFDDELQRRDPERMADVANTRRVASNSAHSNFVAGSDVLVFSASDGDHYLLDPDTLQTVSTLPASRGGFTDLATDAGETRLLTLGADNEIRLYDLGARLQLGVGLPFDATVPFYFGDQRGFALRPDGREAAFVVPGGIAIWDLDPDSWVTAACELASRNLTGEEWDTYLGKSAEYQATCPQFPVDA